MEDTCICNCHKEGGECLAYLVVDALDGGATIEEIEELLKEKRNN